MYRAKHLLGAPHLFKVVYQYRTEGLCDSNGIRKEHAKK